MMKLQYPTWPQRRMEWLLATASFGCGLVYAYSRTMHLLPAYALQLGIASQWFWSLWLVSVGVVRLFFLYVNGIYRQSPHWRALGAGMGCLVWLTQFVSAAAANVIGPTVVIWALFFVADLHIVLSVANEAGRRAAQREVKTSGGYAGGGI